jgi:hypothetical protein
MNENTIVLTRDQLTQLRVEGQTYSDVIPGLVRLIRDGSGYSPQPAVTDQIVLTDRHIRLIELSSDGVAVADARGATTWQITLQPAVTTR